VFNTEDLQGKYGVLKKYRTFILLLKPIETLRENTVAFSPVKKTDRDI
jgi:hypothetical protein